MNHAKSVGALTTQALVLAWRAAPGMLIAHLGLALIAGLTPAAAAWLLKLVLDALTAGRTVTTVIGLAVGLGVVALTSSVITHIDTYVRVELGRAIERTAQSELYDAVNRLAGLVRFEDPEFRDRLHLAQNSGRAAPAQLLESLMGLAKGTITVASFTLALAISAPWMAACIALAAIPTIRAEIWLSRHRVDLESRVTQRLRKEHFFGEILSRAESVKEIRLFGLGSHFRVLLLKEITSVHADRRVVDQRELRVQTVLSALGMLVASAGTIWAVVEAARGALTVGDLTMFISAVAATQAALAGMIGDVASGHTSALNFARYREVTTVGPDLPQPATPAAVQPLTDAIELRDIWFRYAPDQPWVLRGVNLTLTAGRTVALVGLNGSGKSTLIKLLCRLYDPDSGVILWNGTDIREIGVDALRARIGTVFQEFVRYDLTARENIGLGDLRSLDDLDAVTAAARSALAHHTVAALPKGYETLLTRTFFDETDRKNPETGVLLSGGQWQRVAVARALVRDRSELLIMDEPSSGLDPDAEFDIHTSLTKFRQGRTTLLISHRLNTVRDADLIAVLDQGVIAEQGSHDELMTLGGQYARLFTRQADGYLVGA